MIELESPRFAVDHSELIKPEARRMQALFVNMHNKEFLFGSFVKGSVVIDHALGVQGTRNTGLKQNANRFQDRRQPCYRDPALNELDSWKGMEGYAKKQVECQSRLL